MLRICRERELINQALRGGLGAENQEPVPELKAVAPPSVSEDALARAKMTGTEIAAAKKRAAEEAKQREKEEKVAAKAESDRLRKIAEDEGDRLFAAAEAALSSGDVDAARANEQAATAAYESRKIARTTTLRKLREQIKVAAKALDAKRRAEAQAAAARAAEEEAAREREAARVAQLKELQDKAARAADIQAKAQQSGAKIPTFIASQMASGPSSTAPVAPAGPPKVSAELRSAAQMTGAELAAVKKAERDAANQQAKAEACGIVGIAALADADHCQGQDDQAKGAGCVAVNHLGPGLEGFYRVIRKAQLRRLQRMITLRHGKKAIAAGPVRAAQAGVGEVGAPPREPGCLRARKERGARGGGARTETGGLVRRRRRRGGVAPPPRGAAAGGDRG